MTATQRTEHDVVASEQATSGTTAEALRTASGGFVMVALDQRESLRRMFPLVDGHQVADQVLRDFKREALRALSPHASAVLLDRLYALDGTRPPELADGCALILAADVLHQPEGSPVLSTALDPEVTADYVRQVGAAAVKLLVMWRERDDRTSRDELVQSFVALAEEAGVASLVEGIVRPSVGEVWSEPAARHEAVLEAATELAGHGASIYKAEVPGYAPGDLSLVQEHSTRMSQVLPVPWVVLSNGVVQDDFPAAVTAAVAGGAAGFLAGRAVWSDTVADVDFTAALHDRSVPRLRALAELVREGRSW